MWAVAALVSGLMGTAGGETLGSVLADHGVPENRFSEVEGRLAITSYAVSTGGSIFLLAYYEDDGSGRLPRRMHVFRFDRASGRSKQAVLRGREFEMTAVMDQLPDSCLGSAIGISEQNGLIGIDTHLSPSAGCVLFLTSDLGWKAALPGTLLARLRSEMILRGNTVHFAPTEPGSLGIFDPERMQLTPVYPTDGDAERREFSKLLKEHLPSEAWCRESNNACDPTSFTVNFLNVRTDPARNAFSFDAQMVPDGFGKDADAAIRARTVHYECAQKDGRWVLVIGFQAVKRS